MHQSNAENIWLPMFPFWYQGTSTSISCRSMHRICRIQPFWQWPWSVRVRSLHDRLRIAAHVYGFKCCGVVLSYGYYLVWNNSIRIKNRGVDFLRQTEKWPQKWRWVTRKSMQQHKPVLVVMFGILLLQTKHRNSHLLSNNDTESITTDR